MKIPEPVVEAAHRLERRVGWQKLPLPVGVAVIAALRQRLRDRNLFDTGVPPDLTVPEANGDGNARYLTARMPDGSFNDVENPLLGTAGTRFSRNVPLEETHPETEPRLSTPNARTISRKLMTRDEFIPATSMNVLSAAWIQFEVHDWFSHGPNDAKEPYEIPLEDDDDWHERPMVIRRTPRDETSEPGAPQTWRTRNTHWWDGTQIYGSGDLAVRERTNEGGKLRIDTDGLLPADLEDALDYSDVPGAMWTGLYAMHILFTLEHNAICDRLRSEHPTWTDEQLYDKARLVNSALLAKIHILDFTPAVTGHPTWKYLMKVSWWGLAGEWVHRRFGRISKVEEISGIPGMMVNHFGHPYALSEEFVAVYRMHPLLPDTYEFRALDDAVIAQHDFPDLLAPHARDRMAELTMPNVLYWLGIATPGQIVLHDYPRHLQRFERADGNPLADVRVRQALAMSIDKHYIVDTSPAWASFPPAPTCRRTARCPISAGCRAPTTPPGPTKALHPRGAAGSACAPATASPAPGPGLPYDPETGARKLLAEAGYPAARASPPCRSSSTTRTPPAGRSPRRSRTSGERELGIEPANQGIEGKVFQRKCTKKDYVIATVAWYGDYPDVSTFTDKYLSTSLQNDSDWKNKPFDDLCAGPRRARTRPSAPRSSRRPSTCSTPRCRSSRCTTT